MRLDELAAQIDAELVGEPDIEVRSASTLDEAGPGQLSFLINPKYARQLDITRASAVITGPGATSPRVALLRAKNPHYALVRAVVLLHGHRRHPHQGVHKQAFVDPTATVGEGTVIYPGVYVGENVKIGRDCVIYPNVAIYSDCVLGDRVTLHAGTVIGEDGFGYATQNGEHHKIPHAGNVVIEDDVEIGANCTVDRATFGSTVIGQGTKTSNLVAIAHNCRIGPHGLIVALVGIAGSVSIGHHVTIAGQAGIAGHLKIGDHVTIGAQSGVMTDLADQTVALGAPALPIARARRIAAIQSQLPELLERIRQLEQQVNELSQDEKSQA